VFAEIVENLLAFDRDGIGGPALSGPPHRADLVDSEFPLSRISTRIDRKRLVYPGRLPITDCHQA
ncbi:MAG: hypothetical protein OEN22_05255, partial [Gammaproteobacteria bacterium]|nr:hypothetical protein [Gammaproteobacteria bacterium]